MYVTDFMAIYLTVAENFQFGPTHGPQLRSAVPNHRLGKKSLR